MALFSTNGAKLPHRLRIAILLLRAALGLDFFYLGWTTLFNPALAKDLSARSLGDVYAWLAGNPWNGLGPLLAWVFVIAGICIAIGLLMRTAAAVAIVLTAISYWPHIPDSTLGFATLTNSEVLAVIALAVLIFANAGRYVGIDTFLHIHLANKHKG